MQNKNVGHVFYYAPGVSSPKLDVVNLEYKSVEDFGVVPVCVIFGEYGKAYEQFMNFFPSDKLNRHYVRHLKFYNGLYDCAVQNKIPWIMIADKISNVYEASKIKERTNIAKARYFEVYDIKKHYKELRHIVDNVKEKEYSYIDYTIKILGSKFNFLKDVFEDYLQIFLWYGDYRFHELHSYVEKLIQIYYINQIPKQAGMYWKTGGTVNVVDLIKRNRKND